MLWGKKTLERSKSPEQALEIMIQLNNKYGLDGRDPYSNSGIFWVLGRYDRPWGPVRPVCSSIRYMSSQNAARKVSLKEHIRKHAPAGGAKADQSLLFRQECEKRRANRAISAFRLDPVRPCC